MFTFHLTPGYAPNLEAQMRATRPGQAHWAGSGPPGTTCGECAHLGYFRKHQNGSGDTVRTHRVGGCAKFHELTQKHGPAVAKGAPACKYFQPKQ